MKNVMVDVETLGTRADAIIMSIGAVEFDFGGDALGRMFYKSISIDSNLALGRVLSESTLVWWMQQTTEAQKVFHEEKVHLASALNELQDWFPNGAQIWSNGASFDIPMLEHAYAQCEIEPPWNFWDSRCMRTYKDLPGAKGVERPEPKVAHNALDDAITQALYVQRIHAALFGEREVA